MFIQQRKNRSNFLLTDFSNKETNWSQGRLSNLLATPINLEGLTMSSQNSRFRKKHPIRGGRFRVSNLKNFQRRSQRQSEKVGVICW